jgi:ABC-type transport system substrate-binding protein
VAAALVQDALHAQGIIAEQKIYPAPLLIAPADGGGILTGGKFQLELDTFVSNPDPDVSWLVACNERAPAGFNVWNYCSPATDALLADARTTFSRPRRLRDYSQIQQNLADDVPSVDLFHVNEYDVSPEWLQGLAPSEFSLVWNVWQWREQSPLSGGKP